MPSRKPRVALTLPDDLNAVFERIAELQGVPKTKVILELLAAYQPILEEALKALEKLRKTRKTLKPLLKSLPTQCS